MKKIYQEVKGFFHSLLSADGSISSKRYVTIVTLWLLAWYVVYTAECRIDPNLFVLFGLIGLILLSSGLTTFEKLSELVQKLKGGEK